MAIYHLWLGIVQRSKGQSVVAIAADRARVRLHDTRLGRVVTPLPAKRGAVPLHSEVLLPDGARAAYQDRITLWNTVEATERRHDSQLGVTSRFAQNCTLRQEPW